MLRKILFLFVLVVPLSAQAASSAEISKFLLGKWKVESIKKQDSTNYQSLKRPRQWEFTKDGNLIEALGSEGAKVEWHYHVVGDEIKVSLGGMAFSWKVLSIDQHSMLIRHQLGVVKAKHL